MSEIIIDSLQDCAALDNDSVDDYCKKVMQLVKICQKCSNDLQGWHHYRDYRGVKTTMKKVQKRLHTLISNIFGHQEINLCIAGLSLENMFDLFREGNDAMLERIDTNLDEASGVRRTAVVELVDNTVRTIRGRVNQMTGRDIVLIAPRNVQKPQLFFPTKVNNSFKEPFLPKLKEKPNSIKPLAIMLCTNEDDSEYFSHPYEYELQHWSVDKDLLKIIEPIKPLSMEETPLQRISTRDGLVTLMEELKLCNAIAIDLEHHGFRSYLGLSCLIQISTREKDYVIDPFPLMDDLIILNEVFTHPKITKVFHGADFDILWLQRDFGLYIVNMFDTHQAAVVLDYPHRSLAALLHTFCSLTADKKYQRADWRIRPLPEDFITYARQDTHYLLYIYDLLRNELINNGNELNNLLHATYDRSREICMKRFERPYVGPDSHLGLYRKSRKNFNPRQLYVLQQIFQWRDKVAREQDECVDYVLPKHMMLRMAEVLPKEMQGILACCNPIPIFVKTEQLTLHQIIKSASDLSLEDLSKITGVMEGSNDHSGTVQEEMVSNLVCRHDLSQVDDASGLVTLLKKQETRQVDHPLLHNVVKKVSNLYGLKTTSITCDRTWRNLITEEFSSPFERYKLYLETNPTLDQEEQAPRKSKVATSSEASTLNKEDNEAENALDTSQTSEPNSDVQRILRLQRHIVAVSTEEDQVLTPQPTLPARKKKMSILDLKQMQDDAKKGKNKKRKSSEKFDRSKKIKNDKTSSAVVNGYEIDVTAVNDDGEIDVTDVKDDGEIDVNHVDAKSSPFDYSTADYSMFGRNKGKGRNRKIKEKFKSHRSNKSTGLKKSGFKSISWGGK